MQDFIDDADTNRLEDLKLFKKKYGMSNMRKCIAYYEAGIPERYWFTPENKRVLTNKVLSDISVDLSDNVWVFISSKKITIANKAIAEVATALIGARIAWFDLLSLFIELRRNKINTIVSSYNCFFISGVMPSEIYKNNYENFMMFLNMVYNARTTKSIVFAIKNIDDEEFYSTYGGLEEYLFAAKEIQV